ncbi:MAG: hypothetical protein L6Q95_16575 [Planctomycetes bacterium]|nr:hypothetical protein [Planctomycetota bacterium]
MRQELIDLLLGELPPAEAEALKARVSAEPGLRRELAELESLFGLMRRGEAVEPLPATREALVAAAARAKPPLLPRLRAIPGLVAYRFRTSVRFRVAVVSLAAHVILIAILANMLLRPGDPFDRDIVVTWKEAPEERVEPAQDFEARLAQRRLPRSTRLRQYGVDGQERAIERGLETLLAKQRPSRFSRRATAPRRRTRAVTRSGWRAATSSPRRGAGRPTEPCSRRSSRTSPSRTRS